MTVLLYTSASIAPPFFSEVTLTNVQLLIVNSSILFWISHFTPMAPAEKSACRLMNVEFSITVALFPRIAVVYLEVVFANVELYTYR